MRGTMMDFPLTLQHIFERTANFSQKLKSFRDGRTGR